MGFRGPYFEVIWEFSTVPAESDIFSDPHPSPESLRAPQFKEGLYTLNPKSYMPLHTFRHSEIYIPIFTHAFYRCIFTPMYTPVTPWKGPQGTCLHKYRAVHASLQFLCRYTHAKGTTIILMIPPKILVSISFCFFFSI